MPITVILSQNAREKLVREQLRLLSPTTIVGGENAQVVSVRSVARTETAFTWMRSIWITWAVFSTRIHPPILMAQIYRTPSLREAIGRQLLPIKQYLSLLSTLRRILAAQLLLRQQAAAHQQIDRMGLRGYRHHQGDQQRQGQLPPCSRRGVDQANRVRPPSLLHQPKPTGAKATRPKVKPKKETSAEDKRKSVAVYPLSNGEENMADAIPSWTQPKLREGNWDEVSDFLLFIQMPTDWNQRSCCLSLHGRKVWKTIMRMLMVVRNQRRSRHRLSRWVLTTILREFEL